jgi:hypothetical protein
VIMTVSVATAPCPRESALELGVRRRRKWRLKVVAVEKSTIVRSNRYLLFYTAAVWLCYLFALVTPSSNELVRGFLVGCFVSALMWSTITVGLAVYGAARYRYRGYLVTVLLAAPLSILCWYHMIHWPLP